MQRLKPELFLTLVRHGFYETAGFVKFFPLAAFLVFSFFFFFFPCCPFISGFYPHSDELVTNSVHFGVRYRGTGAAI